MGLEDFIRKVESEIEEIKPGTLKSDTVFRNVPAWSSMHALILIALADAEYNVTLTGEDLRSCKTIGEIYSVIEKRKKS